MNRRPVAVLDACVLVPMPLADTLLRLAEPPALFEARWSEEILAEVTRTLVGRFGKTPEKARYRERAMRQFFPDSIVSDYEHLIIQMRNDPKDRHVLAAAVRSRAGYLVTFNLRHFAAILAGNVRVIGPSAFLSHLWTLHPCEVTERIALQASAIGISSDLLLDRLEKSVPNFVRSVFRDNKDGCSSEPSKSLIVG